MASSVSPVLIQTVLEGDLSVVHKDEDDVGDTEGQPGKNDHSSIHVGAISEVEDDLAKKTSMFKDAHQDKPVGDHQMLFLLLAANIGDDKEDEGDNDAREGNQIDVEVRKGGTCAC